MPKKGVRVLMAVFLASIFIVLLSASVYAPGYNFFVYNLASVERNCLFRKQKARLQILKVKVASDMIFSNKKLHSK